MTSESSIGSSVPYQKMVEEESPKVGKTKTGKAPSTAPSLPSAAAAKASTASSNKANTTAKKTSNLPEAQKLAEVKVGKNKIDIGCLKFKLSNSGDLQQLLTTKAAKLLKTAHPPDELVDEHLISKPTERQKTEFNSLVKNGKGFIENYVKKAGVTEYGQITKDLWTGKSIKSESITPEKIIKLAEDFCLTSFIKDNVLKRANIKEIPNFYCTTTTEGLENPHQVLHLAGDVKSQEDREGIIKAIQQIYRIPINASKLVIKNA